MMKRFLYGLAALPFLAGVSLAAQPVPLTDTQMDKVTAGFDFHEVEIQNTGWVSVGVNEPAPTPAGPITPPVAYLVVTNRYFGSGAIAMQTATGFGPP